MKRVITANDGQGRSYILKTEEVAPAGPVWHMPPGNLMGQEPENVGYDLSFPAGAHVRSIAIPPEAVMAEFLKTGIPGLDERGFHRTGSLDVIVLLEGRLILELDEASVELAPGDVVIQRDTNHAWRNPGTTDARCLAVILR